MPPLPPEHASCVTSRVHDCRGARVRGPALCSQCLRRDRADPPSTAGTAPRLPPSPSCRSSSRAPSAPVQGGPAAIGVRGRRLQSSRAGTGSQRREKAECVMKDTLLVSVSFHGLARLATHAWGEGRGGDARRHPKGDVFLGRSTSIPQGEAPIPRAKHKYSPGRSAYP